MLFITNRFPTQSIRTRVDRPFNFDLKNNAASNSVYYCEEVGEGQYEEVGSKAFLRRLKEANARQVLIYIHGFANLPDDVLRATREFQALCDASEPGEVLVVPLIWPCDNDLGIVKDYWDDQESADLSAFSFARVLQRFLDWREGDQFVSDPTPCLKRINVLAHSMGNRVLRETLRLWRKYYLPGGVPLLFRNTFLIAADIVNESLEEGHSGEPITHASRKGCSSSTVSTRRATDPLGPHISKAPTWPCGPARPRTCATASPPVVSATPARRTCPRWGATSSPWTATTSTPATTSPRGTPTSARAMSTASPAWCPWNAARGTGLVSRPEISWMVSRPRARFSRRWFR